MSNFTPSDPSAQSNGDNGGINQSEPQPLRQHDYGKKHTNEHAEKLHRSIYVLILTIIYAGLAIFAWGILCILVHRPLGASSYTEITRPEGKTYVESEQLESVLVKSKHYLRVAKVLLSVVSLSTIPLTSTVCSQAAVAFVQKSRMGPKKGPTLRQTIALANKSWTDLILISKLISGKWNLHGSSFLLFALFLNILGSSISPLQNLLLSIITIPSPTTPSFFVGLMDISDHFPADSGGDPIITLLASKLLATSLYDPQMKLWCPNGTYHKTSPSSPNSLESIISGPYGFHSFFAFDFPVDAYWSQLPYDFSTGLQKAVMPRINSSASWDIITGKEYPTECHRIPNALYFSYSGSIGKSTDSRYHFKVCMPSNITQTPWRNQTTRQDFTEELYLNMTFQGEGSFMFYPEGTYLARIKLSTTAGYFELPNYDNKETAGPLLSGDALPGLKKEPQYFPPYHEEPPIPLSQMNTSMSLKYSTNKGPLLYIALALFGPGSFADGQHNSLNTYKSEAFNRWGEGPCTERIPFVSLMDHVGYLDFLGYCANSGDLVEGPGHVIAPWLSIFTSNTTSKRSIERALNSAAFLAVDSWMSGVRMTGPNQSGSLRVNYDPGVEIQVPHIPKSGIILISTLLGLHLLFLLALSLYCAYTPRWTTQLDAFAMMRLGASLVDDIPFLMTRDADKIYVLDDLPGWIGDDVKRESGDKELSVVGKLALGGETILTGQQKYAAYGLGKRQEARHRYNIDQPRYSPAYTSMATDRQL